MVHLTWYSWGESFPARAFSANSLTLFDSVARPLVSALVRMGVMSPFSVVAIIISGVSTGIIIWQKKKTSTGGNGNGNVCMMVSGIVHVCEGVHIWGKAKRRKRLTAE